MKSRTWQVMNLAIMALVAVVLITGMEFIGDMRESRRSLADRNSAFQAILSASAYLEKAVPADHAEANRIESVYLAQDSQGAPIGYVMTLTVPGYIDDIRIRVAVESDGNRIRGVDILQSDEDPMAADILKPYFSSQFEDLAVPVYLRGEEPEVLPEPRVLRDGTYFVSADEPDAVNGYIYTLRIVVQSGQIVNAVWDGVSDDRENTTTLRSASEAGEFEVAEGELPWHQQAIALEARLLQDKDPDFIKVRSDGSVEGLDSVTVSAKPFVDLAETCVKRAAVPSGLAGTMRDGFYQATGRGFDEETGYRDVVEMEISNGKIVSVFWDGESQDSDLTRVESSLEGFPDPAIPDSLWHVEAEMVGFYLLTVQDPTVIQTDYLGMTNEIPVQVPIDKFLELVQTCMMQAGMVPAPTPTPVPEAPDTSVDAVAGASVSSRAVVDAANLAASYAQELNNLQASD